MPSAAPSGGLTFPDSGPKRRVACGRNSFSDEILALPISSSDKLLLPKVLWQGDPEDLFQWREPDPIVPKRIA